MGSSASAAFLYHLQLTLGLLAFTIATILFIWAVRNEGKGVKFGRTISIIVMILSVVSMSCAGYYAIRYLLAGVFEPSAVMSNTGMVGNKMMNGEMNMQMEKKH